MRVIEDLWNFDMTTAPRGEIVEEEKKVGKNLTTVTYHKPVDILACSKCEIVTKSRWVVDKDKDGNLDIDSGRWNMFGSKEVPVAWMPWPNHPHLGDKNESY